MLNTIIDPQIDRGTATNQMLVWNPTTKRFAVSVSLSGLTLNSPVIAGTVNTGGQTTTFGTGLAAFGGAVTATGTLRANGDFTNGAVTLIDGTSQWSIADNNGNAWVVQEGNNEYIGISTLNGLENISFGNFTTNPTIKFLSSPLKVAVSLRYVLCCSRPSH